MPNGPEVWDGGLTTPWVAVTEQAEMDTKAIAADNPLNILMI
jgi:hypothetical protein